MTHYTHTTYNGEAIVMQVGTTFGDLKQLKPPEYQLTADDLVTKGMCFGLGTALGISGEIVMDTTKPFWGKKDATQGHKTELLDDDTIIHFAQGFNSYGAYAQKNAIRLENVHAENRQEFDDIVTKAIVKEGKNPSNYAGMILDATFEEDGNQLRVVDGLEASYEDLGQIMLNQYIWHPPENEIFSGFFIASQQGGACCHDTPVGGGSHIHLCSEYNLVSKIPKHAGHALKIDKGVYKGIFIMPFEPWQHYISIMIKDEEGIRNAPSGRR